MTENNKRQPAETIELFVIVANRIEYFKPKGREEQFSRPVTTVYGPYKSEEHARADFVQMNRKANAVTYTIKPIKTLVTLHNACDVTKIRSHKAH